MKLLAIVGLIGAAGAAAPITITSADVRASNEELASAYSSLVSMWTAEFRDIGERFATPRLARYRGNIRSVCGTIPAYNAAYCDANNTIYYDEVFLAAQAKITGQALRTDGDMAGVGIIAHEMGHAVTAQLGTRFRSSYSREAAADCLAGAFARHAEREGSLEKGDLDEAFYAMAAAADPELRSTGDERLDARRQRALERDRHGTREQRQQNFRRGYERGSNACVSAR